MTAGFVKVITDSIITICNSSKKQSTQLHQLAIISNNLTINSTSILALENNISIVFSFTPFLHPDHQ